MNVSTNPVPTISSVLTQPTTCVSADGAINITNRRRGRTYTYGWSTSGGSGLVNGVEDQSGLYSGSIHGGGHCSKWLPGHRSIQPDRTGWLRNLPDDHQPRNESFRCNLCRYSGNDHGIRADLYGNYVCITFKYSTVALADPYSGGTLIATVPNGSLTGGGTIATTTTSFSSANYIIYAILSPVPIDPSCRSFNQVNLTVGAVPTVNPVANQIICNGGDNRRASFSGAIPGTVYNWTNNNTTIGLAANGTGNIASFVATNSGTAPVVATVTVTPSNTTTAPLSQTFTYNGSAESFTVPAGVTSLKQDATKPVE